MTTSHSTPSLESFLHRDLEYLCEQLLQEFGHMAGKRLLITGGAGFLGYYLVLAVRHWNQTRTNGKPVQLTVYDNFVRGLPAWLETLGDPHIEWVRHDMRDPLPEDMGDFEYIVHAAGIASPTYYRLHPIETMDANINGLRNLLDYALRQQQCHKPVEGLLFYSSSEIYGDPDPRWIPTPEDYRGNVSCTGPRACYDESKRFGETLCVTFARQHGLPITIARPFNNYGPGLKITDRRVLPDFARDVLQGRDIAMYSDGSPKRTFCYSADAVAGYYKVLVNGRAGEAYNIGIEKPEITIAELAELLIDKAHALFGYQGRLLRQASPEEDYLVDNPNRRCPVIAKARTELGYNPCIGIEEGIERTLVWYSYHREAAEG